MAGHVVYRGLYHLPLRMAGRCMDMVHWRYPKCHFNIRSAHNSVILQGEESI